MNIVSTNLKTHLLLILATFFWGINPILMKIALAEIDIIPFSVLRLFAGFLTALIIMLLSRNREKIELRDRILILVIGIFGFFIFQLNYTVGVNYTSASISAIILATLPVFVLIINFFTRMEKLSVRLIMGVALSFLGVFIISAGSSRGFSIEGTYTVGVVLLVIGEAAYAYYMVKSKILINKYTIGQVLFNIITISFVLFIIIYIPRFSISDFTGVSIKVWLGIVFSGVFSMAIANVMWYYGIRRLGTSRTAIYGNLPPVFGITAGFIFLGETLALLQVVGAVVIGIGIILVNRKKCLIHYTIH